MPAHASAALDSPGGAFVGIDPASATRLAERLDEVAGRAQWLAPWLDGALAVAGRSCAAPARIREIGEWATAASAEVRWRVAAATAAYEDTPDTGMLLFTAAFSSLEEATAAGRDDADRLAVLLDGYTPEDAEADLSALLRRITHRGRDPAYAGALVEALAVDTLTALTGAAYGYATVQRLSPDGATGTGSALHRNPPWRLVRPLAAAIATASRSGTADRGTLERLIERSNPHALAQLFWFDQRFDPAFTGAAASRILVDLPPHHLQPALLLTGGLWAVPDWGRRWASRAIPEQAMLAALAADPEAAHRFVTTGSQYRVLLDGRRFPDEGALAGQALAAALVDHRIAAHADGESVRDSERVATRVVEEVGAGDHHLTAAMRPPLGIIAGHYVSDIAWASTQSAPPVVQRVTRPGITLSDEQWGQFLTRVMVSQEATLAVVAAARDFIPRRIAVAAEQYAGSRDRSVLSSPAWEVGGLAGLIASARASATATIQAAEEARRELLERLAIDGFDGAGILATLAGGPAGGAAGIAARAATRAAVGQGVRWLSQRAAELAAGPPGPDGPGPGGSLPPGRFEAEVKHELKVAIAAQLAVHDVVPGPRPLVPDRHARSAPDTLLGDGAVPADGELTPVMREAVSAWASSEEVTAHFGDGVLVSYWGAFDRLADVRWLEGERL